MELWKLRYFAVLADELHFGRAAARLRIAQPGLSQQIKGLERELGVVLFDRTGGVTLTPAGELLAGEVPRLLEHADRIAANVRALGKGESGSLRIMLSRSAPGTDMYALVEQFRSRNPGVTVQTETAWTSWNLDALLNQSADIALALMPLLNDSEIDSVQLKEEQLALVLPSKHPLTRRRKIDPRWLAAERFVFWPRGHAPGAYDKLLDDLWPADALPVMDHSEPDSERMVAAVKAGHGFTIMTKSRARQMRAPGVAIRSFTEPSPVYTYGLCWLRNTPSPTVSALINSLQTSHPR